MTQSIAVERFTTNLFQLFDETFEQVRTTLQTFDGWEGEDAMGDAMAMVIHTAYHLGEIRQMLCSVQQGVEPA